MATQHDNIAGAVHFSTARATLVREPGNPENYHSAVYSSVAVYTGTKTEADIVIAAWPEIMSELEIVIASKIQAAQAEAPGS